MKKIEFGFSNDYDSKGSWEGIGIKPGLLLTDAEYYGTVKYEDNSYIVAKVTEDEYGRFPHLVGNFIVRPAIADMYVDGSGTVFLDQEENIVTRQLEECLNSSQVRDRIKDIDDVLNNCYGVHIADKSFRVLTMDSDTVLTTSITHEAFERKNTALKSCRKSFSDLQEQLMGLNNGYKR